MRISDWSSDVCSSDLIQCDYLSRLSTRIVVPLQPEEDAPPPARDLNPVFRIAGTRYVMMTQYMAAVSESELKKRAGRSEEHTSELQSLMRISYAVFCLTKKNTTKSRVKQPKTPTKHSQSHNNRHK